MEFGVLLGFIAAMSCRTHKNYNYYVCPRFLYKEIVGGGAAISLKLLCRMPCTLRWLFPGNPIQLAITWTPKLCKIIALKGLFLMV